MHESSLKNMSRFFKHHLKDNDSILDIGSSNIGNKQTTYKDILPNGKNLKYTGLDIEAGTNVDIVINDVYNWKEVQDESFDVVISGQAFEHIEFFWLTFLEVVRVTKKGGKMCIIAPSVGPVHDYPIDCWRYKPDGMKALAKLANIKIIKTYIDEKSKRWKDCVGIFEKV